MGKLVKKNNPKNKGSSSLFNCLYHMKKIMYNSYCYYFLNVIES